MLHVVGARDHHFLHAVPDEVDETHERASSLTLRYPGLRPSLQDNLATLGQQRMIAPVDLSKLPPAAQKILDPAAPLPLKTMAAKAVVPGLKPADLLVVVVLLASAEGPPAEVARQTLAKLPTPVLNGA